jgi:hypothetical protein
MVQIAVTDRFMADLLGFPSKTQKKCLGLLQELRDVDRRRLASDSKKGWRLHHVKSSPFLSISLSMSLRLLAVVRGEMLTLHRLIKHDQYERPAINRNDARSALAALTPEQLKPEQLFDAVKAFGVDVVRSGPLRQVKSEDDLIAALELLDPDLEELVLALYETTGFTVPRTQYRMLTSDKDLELSMLGDPEDWAFYLHPSQRFVAEAPIDSCLLVLGAAGTGKTVCAWHRVRHLIERGARVAFLCPNNRILDISKERILNFVTDPSKCTFSSEDNPEKISALLMGVDHAVFDEAQDLSPNTTLRRFASFVGGFTIFYDLNQTQRFNKVARGQVEKTRTTIECAFRDLADCQRMEFPINFRNSMEIENFVRENLSTLLPWDLQCTAPMFQAGGVVRVQAGSEGEVHVAVKRALDALLNDFTPGEILVLWCSKGQGAWRRLLNNLEEGYPVHDQLDNQHGILVLQSHKAKGYERKAAIVVTEGFSNIQLFKHAVKTYVALTRARDRLVVVEAASEPPS